MEIQIKNNRKNLLGISGRSGSGKDLVASIIQYLTSNETQRRNIDFYKWDSEVLASCSPFEIKKYADTLKDMVCLLIGCTRAQLEDREFKERELGEEWRVSLNDIEIWKDVIGYEGLYKINNYGVITNVIRKAKNGNILLGEKLSYSIGTNGYYNCRLSKDGLKKTHSVHQLLMYSFTNMKPSKYEYVINHIDNNKLNTVITNLEIVSSRYNSSCHSTSKTATGVYERNGRFEATIRIDGKKKYLGTYKTEELAHSKYLEELDKLPKFETIRVSHINYTPRLLMQTIGTELFRNRLHPNLWVNAMFAKYKAYNKGTPHDLMLDGMSECYRHTACENEDCGKAYSGWKRQRFCKECCENEDVQQYPRWIVSDVRFPANEGTGVTDRGGFNIGVKRLFKLRYPEFAHLEEVDRPYNIPRALEKINQDLFKALTHESEELMGDFTWCDYVIENNGTIDELIIEVERILNLEKIIQDEISN